MHVRLAGVSVVLDGLPIVSDVDLEVSPGSVLGLVGPNGSGKSTLLRTIYRVLRPASGAVLLDSLDVWTQLNARAAAQRTGAVLQNSPGEFDFSVAEVVLMGRAPHKGLLAGDDAHDEDVVRSALLRVGMLDRAWRLFSTLSGGERQRVLLARALAQETRLLVLDEPTNHLDISARFELLELLRDLGLTTIAALHDLDLAASYCDRVAVLTAGRLIASGTVSEVLTPELLASVFGVRAAFGTHPITGRPYLMFAPLDPQSTEESKTIDALEI